MNLSRYRHIVFILAAGGLLTLVMIIVVTQPGRAAGPWYVAPGGDDGNDCLSPGAACASINGAIGKANSGDTVYVATGTYTGAGTEVVLVDKTVTLSGGWGAGFAIQSGASTIDGEGARRGMTVKRSVVVERFAVLNSLCGGITNSSTLILNSSTVSGNSGCGLGAGGITNQGPLTLNNSTVSRNTAGQGGGIANWSHVTLNNGTVSANSADRGGGIRSYGGTVTLQNSILAGNTAASGPDCDADVDSLGYNLVGDTSGCTFSPGTGDLTDIGARLGPLEGSPGYHPLLVGSPAINAGNPAGCTDHLGNPLTTDQRGFPRLGTCDIGAYEVPPLAFSAKVVNLSSALAGDPIAYTIALSNVETVNISDVQVSDTLPITITYIEDSLTATAGSYGYSTGLVTWTGSVNVGAVVTIAFGATVSETAPVGASIANSAFISGGGEIITRSAAVNVIGFVYLPLIVKNQ
jgi:uncharacterized repeat protein (TIGR01451 family)